MFFFLFGERTINDLIMPFAHGRVKIIGTFFINFRLTRSQKLQTQGHFMYWTTRVVEIHPFGCTFSNLPRQVCDQWKETISTCWNTCWNTCWLCILENFDVASNDCVRELIEKWNTLLEGWNQILSILQYLQSVLWNFQGIWVLWATPARKSCSLPSPVAAGHEVQPWPPRLGSLCLFLKEGWSDIHRVWRFVEKLLGAEHSEDELLKDTSLAPAQERWRCWWVELGKSRSLRTGGESFFQQAVGWI